MKDQLNFRVFTMNTSTWRRKMVALQLSPKIVCMVGCTGHKIIRVCMEFSTFPTLPFGQFSAENS